MIIEDIFGELAVLYGPIDYRLPTSIHIFEEASAIPSNSFKKTVVLFGLK